MRGGFAWASKLQRHAAHIVLGLRLRWVKAQRFFKAPLRLRVIASGGQYHSQIRLCRRHARIQAYRGFQMLSGLIPFTGFRQFAAEVGVSEGGIGAQAWR